MKEDKHRSGSLRAALECVELFKTDWTKFKATYSELTTSCAVVHSGVFWENCLGGFSGHSYIVCSIAFCILDFSLFVIVNMAWILGTEISHKRTKEKLKFPQSFPLPFLLLQKLYGSQFLFFCFSCCCFSQSLLSSRKGSQTAREIFLEFSAFPLTNENCSNQTSQIILQWQKVRDTYTRTAIRTQSRGGAVSRWQTIGVISWTCCSLSHREYKLNCLNDRQEARSGFTE